MCGSRQRLKRLRLNFFFYFSLAPRSLSFCAVGCHFDKVCEKSSTFVLCTQERALDGGKQHFVSPSIWKIKNVTKGVWAKTMGATQSVEKRAIRTGFFVQFPLVCVRRHRGWWWNEVEEAPLERAMKRRINMGGMASTYSWKCVHNSAELLIAAYYSLRSRLPWNLIDF